MQAAGRGIRPGTELPTGVEARVDQLDPAQAGLGLDVDRHSTAVVAHLHRAIAVQDHLDPIAVPTEGLVDSVIDDLPEAVHEAATVGGSDVHPGPLTHGLKPLEHLEMVRGVLAGRLAGRRLLRCWTGHAARLVCGTDVRSRRHGLGS